MKVSRRGLIAGGGAGLGGLTFVGTSAWFAPQPACASDPGIEMEVSEFEAEIKAIEIQTGVTIGVCLKNPHGLGAGCGVFEAYYKSSNRFAMCSTFKWVLAAAILKRHDLGELSLTRMIAYSEKDLVTHAPVTGAKVAEGAMSVEELCRAAVVVSDNTAANLLLPLIGGPEGLTRYVQGLRDVTARFDRFEPELNSNINGDVRDTTTPEAMAELLSWIYMKKRLKPESWLRLTQWMKDSSTGLGLIRAGLPLGYSAGDKSGRGANGAVNDVAIIWSPDGLPMFLAIYTTGGDKTAEERNAIIAQVTRLVFKA